MRDINDLPDIMRRQIQVIPESGCWFWTGASCTGKFTNNVYGKVGFTGKTISSHKLSYELLVGPISEGLELDHLCKNTLCCNPHHLEPVTHAENCRRGNSGKHMSSRTHCPQGHEYTPENTYLYRNTRTCRICAREKALRHYHNKWDGKLREPNGDKTHCLNGHEFTPENIYMHEGSRYCRACKRQRSRVWAKRHKA